MTAQPISPCIPRKVFEGFSEKMTTSKDKLLAYFEGKNREHSGDEFPIDPACPATELLLGAVTTGVLAGPWRMAWQQWAVLASCGVDYGVLYAEFCPDLISHMVKRGRWLTRDEYATIGSDGPRNFLIFADELSRVLAGYPDMVPAHLQPSHFAAEPSGLLWTRTDGEWKWFDSREENIVANKKTTPRKVTPMYVAGLPKNRDFVSSVRELRAFMEKTDDIKHLDPKRWAFPLGTCIYTSLSTLIRSGFESQEKNLSCLAGKLFDFCYHWNLTVLRCAEKNSMCEGLSFEAMIVKISIEHDRSGLSVFIPAYYRFSHIKNYEKQDFALLKLLMDKVCGKFQLPKRQSKHREQVLTARRLRKEFKAQDYSKGEAWDETRKAMGWSAETMKKYLGERPEGKTTFQEHLPYWHDE